MRTFFAGGNRGAGEIPNWETVEFLGFLLGQLIKYIGRGYRGRVGHDRIIERDAGVPISFLFYILFYLLFFLNKKNCATESLKANCYLSRYVQGIPYPRMLLLIYKISNIIGTYVARYSPLGGGEKKSLCGP